MPAATEFVSERSTPQDREPDLPPEKPNLRELLVAAKENDRIKDDTLDEDSLVVTSAEDVDPEYGGSGYGAHA
jgi:hypothetical protein